MDVRRDVVGIIGPYLPLGRSGIGQELPRSLVTCLHLLFEVERSMRPLAVGGDNNRQPRSPPLQLASAQSEEAHRRARVMRR